MPQLSLKIHFCLNGNGTELTTILIIIAFNILMEYSFHILCLLFSPSQSLLLLSFSRCIFLYPLIIIFVSPQISILKSNKFDRTMCLLQASEDRSVLEHGRYHVSGDFYHNEKFILQIEGLLSVEEAKISLSLIFSRTKPVKICFLCQTSLLGSKWRQSQLLYAIKGEATMCQALG